MYFACTKSNIVTLKVFSQQKKGYAVDALNIMPTNQKFYNITFLIYRHKISCIHNITFLLLAENFKLTILLYMLAKRCIKVLLLQSILQWAWEFLTSRSKVMLWMHEISCVQMRMIRPNIAWYRVVVVVFNADKLCQSWHYVLKCGNE